MNKKIRKKDLLARLEAAEKWQKEHDRREMERLAAEIKALEAIVRPSAIDFSDKQNAMVFDVR